MSGPSFFFGEQVMSGDVGLGSESCYVGANDLLEDLQDLAILSMAAILILRVDEFAVDPHVVDAIGTSY